MLLLQSSRPLHSSSTAQGRPVSDRTDRKTGGRRFRPRCRCSSAQRTLIVAIDSNPNSEQAEQSQSCAHSVLENCMNSDSVLFEKKKNTEPDESFRSDIVYESARRQMTFDTVDGYRFAIQKFREIRGWKDADELIAVCERRVKEIEALEEPERLERERKAEEARIAKEQAARKRKKAIAVAAPIALVCIVLAILLTVEVISTRPARCLRSSAAEDRRRNGTITR